MAWQAVSLQPWLKELVMKQSFNTSKLYYDFPYLHLGVSGPELWEQYIRPAVPLIASRRVAGVGVGAAEENAADQIKHYQLFAM